MASSTPVFLFLVIREEAIEHASLLNQHGCANRE